MTDLQALVTEIVVRHGGVRVAARAVSLDAGYISRLQSGDADNPSDQALRKLGIKKVISYTKDRQHEMHKTAQIEALRERERRLTDLLESVRTVCQRKGAETAWERLDAQIAKAGVGAITAKTFRILPSDKEQS